jgi:hypothetical protein
MPVLQLHFFEPDARVGGANRPLCSGVCGIACDGLGPQFSRLLADRMMW